MPFPNPATHSPDEAALVRTILAHHAADLPKLVYADWLEERGDPRGPFLRAFVEATADGSPYPDPAGFPQPWLDLMGVPALTACRQHALPLTPVELLLKARPAFGITEQQIGDEMIPLRASKFGGGADVPDGFEWPTHRGNALDFLAQFDLAELAASPAADALPRTGLLSVFFHSAGGVSDSGDVGGWRFYRFDESEPLRRLLHPGSSIANPRNACRLDFDETLTLPENWCWSESVSDEVQETYRNEVSETGLHHQLLGWPRFLQSDADWFSINGLVRHLMTLGSNFELDWTWGDAGLLYFGIPTDALRTGDFSKTDFDFQSC